MKWFCSERCLEEMVVSKSQREHDHSQERGNEKHSNDKQQRGWTISVRKSCWGKGNEPGYAEISRKRQRGRSCI